MRLDDRAYPSMIKTSLAAFNYTSLESDTVTQDTTFDTIVKQAIRERCC